MERFEDCEAAFQADRGHQVLSKAFPLLSIVVVLFPMGAFMLASPTLLVLKHDTPLDGRFIRGLFNLYYISVMTLAAVFAAACALLGRGAVALAMSGLVVFVFGIRRWMISNMDEVRGAMARVSRWLCRGSGACMSRG